MSLGFRQGADAVREGERPLEIGEAELALQVMPVRDPPTLSQFLQQPLLFKPLMLSVPEPTDGEIEQRLGRAAL